MQILAAFVALFVLAFAAWGEVGSEKCFTCHEEVKELFQKSKHEGFDCITCHDGLDQHLKTSASKPLTKIDQQVCGSCHANQYESFFAVNHAPTSRAKMEKATPTGRGGPLYDKLMAGHGFTKEHNEPRGHAFMLIDHLIVDRGYGGRFQLKNWRQITKTGKAWDIVKDTGKDDWRETVKAANPTCLTCKTSNHLLSWKYMGDKDPRAKWDRTSKVVDFAKSLQNPVGCVHCHDPHATRPRIVRDALIEAVERDGPEPYLANGKSKTSVKVMDFRNFRKIGILSRTDSRLMCGQCHVEYNCNPGLDAKNGAKIGFEDRRTNLFPLKKAADLKNFYDKNNFRDFKHATTSALLIKSQHPELEVFWGSKHDKAGVQCHDCHMPKVKAKEGTIYTTHMAASPKNFMKETCLKCHPGSESDEKYQIDAIQNYTKGKMRKTETWLSKLIDTYAKAKSVGVDEETLAKARSFHDEAHVLWEFWTAENSDGFHNPDEARENLTRSIEIARKGIEFLEKAIK